MDLVWLHFTDENSEEQRGTGKVDLEKAYRIPHDIWESDKQIIVCVSMSQILHMGYTYLPVIPLPWFIWQPYAQVTWQGVSRDWDQDPGLLSLVCCSCHWTGGFKHMVCVPPVPSSCAQGRPGSGIMEFFPPEPHLSLRTVCRRPQLFDQGWPSMWGPFAVLAPDDAVKPSGVSRH